MFLVVYVSVEGAGPGVSLILPPGEVSIVTILGWGWMEAKDAGQCPPVLRTAPLQRTTQEEKPWPSPGTGLEAAGLGPLGPGPAPAPAGPACL